MRIVLTAFLLIFHTAFAQQKKASLLGLALGYQDHFIQGGISTFKDKGSLIYTARATLTFDYNLNDKTQRITASGSIGKIFCFGYDLSSYFKNKTEGMLILFRPKVGIGYNKFGLITYGFNMFTNGERYWTWGIELNIPVLQLYRKKK